MQLPAKTPGKAAENGPSPPCGDLDGLPGSWLRLGPALTTGAMCGASQGLVCDFAFKQANLRFLVCQVGTPSADVLGCCIYTLRGSSDFDSALLNYPAT